MNGFAAVLVALTFATMVSSHPGQLTDRNKRAAEQGDVPVVPSKTPCGDEKSLCETTDQYSAEYIDRILKNSGDQFKYLLGVDELSVEVGLRANLGTEFEICRSTEQVLFPKTAQNKDGDWRFVINQPNHFQGIRAEICYAQDRPCELSGTFPTGYNSSCQQKYIYRKLIVLSPNGTLAEELVKIPSSCSCFVTSPLRKKFDSAISGKETSQQTSKNMPTQEADTRTSGSQVGDVTNTPTTKNCGDNTTSCEPTKELPSDSQGIGKNGRTRRDANEEKTLDGVNRRNETDATEFELCSSIQQFFFSMPVRNNDNERPNVLSHPDYRTSFMMEICSGIDLPCTLSENFPKGYKSLCKQKYFYSRVLTKSMNGTFSFHTIKLPSACSCVVTNTLGME